MSTPPHPYPSSWPSPSPVSRRWRSLHRCARRRGTQCDSRPLRLARPLGLARPQRSGLPLFRRSRRRTFAVAKRWQSLVRRCRRSHCLAKVSLNSALPRRVSRGCGRLRHRSAAVGATLRRPPESSQLVCRRLASSSGSRRWRWPIQTARFGPSRRMRPLARSFKRAPFIAPCTSMSREIPCRSSTRRSPRSRLSRRSSRRAGRPATNHRGPHQR